MKKTTLYLNLGSIGFSISQAMIILLQALLFYWGGKLTAEEGLVGRVGSIKMGRLHADRVFPQSTVALFASFEAIIIAASCTLLFLAK